MSSPEFNEILQSVQELVRRAYAQGRADALKQVLQVMQADEATPKPPLALGAPTYGDAIASASRASRANANSNTVQGGTRPWWERVN